eukprot:CAMPEP_0194218856 /NCGR_PEP_ID=MMETSP0156-20130528/24658_1 /TAXON_ID=33649 /ORGANISM="Thalassionema nitzschioides, Strain L26-B" /LENGTH=280 /DNA_ID=CAMNT_0038948341 /DNA_START=32 /DNA_END=874 /DNA_ORIENTATION=-
MYGYLYLSIVALVTLSTASADGLRGNEEPKKSEFETFFKSILARQGWTLNEDPRSVLSKPLVPFYTNYDVFLDDLVAAKVSPPLSDDNCLPEAFQIAGQDGLWMEFGVYTGVTIKQMANARINNGIVYGFDSFLGAPEDQEKVNNHNLGGTPPFSGTDRITWVTGWFEETVPNFLLGADENISLMHMDAHRYDSTKAVFHSAQSWLTPGVVIALNDLMLTLDGHKGNHEALALYELLQVRPDLGFNLICKSGHAAAIQLCSNGMDDCMIPANNDVEIASE